MMYWVVPLLHGWLTNLESVLDRVKPNFRIQKRDLYVTANCNSLASEVHDTILSLFCQEIINEYNSVVLVLDDIEDLKHPSDYCSYDKEWPAKPPSSLKDYSSALHSCRSFYYSIKRIKINGESPITKLQSLQDEKCAAFHEISYHAPNRVGIRRVTRLVGFFWKNPLVFRKPEIMMKALVSLTPDSLILLIP